MNPQTTNSNPRLPSVIAAARNGSGTQARTAQSKQLLWLKRVLHRLDQVSPTLAASYALKLFLRPARRASRSQEIDVLSRATQSRLDTREGAVRVYAWGDGPVVLLNHGWEGQAGNMTSFVGPLVSRGFRVVAFDATAHGRSPGRTATLGSFAFVIRELLQRHAPIRAMIGHSLGGSASALVLAEGAADAANVQRLVLISPPCRPGDGIAQFGKFLGLSELAIARMKLGLAKKMGKPLEHYEVDRCARGLSMPALIVHDRNDYLVPYADAEAVARALRGSQLVETRGLGHRKILSDPDVVARVTAFVAHA